MKEKIQSSAADQIGSGKAHHLFDLLAVVGSIAVISASATGWFGVKRALHEFGNGVVEKPLALFAQGYFSMVDCALKPFIHDPYRLFGCTRMLFTAVDIDKLYQGFYIGGFLFIQIIKQTGHGLVILPLSGCQYRQAKKDLRTDLAHKEIAPRSL